MLTSSVAMCTYNGARFVEEQLASILRGTRLPDEIVVNDDRSTDDTAAVVGRIAAASAVPIRPEVNPAQLRSTQNFATAIARCTGDVIFLADQDDSWAPDKLERVMALFAAEPDLGGVFSDAALVDDRLRPLGRTMFGDLGLTREDRDRLRADRAFELLLSRAFITGATLAFRRSLLPAILPIPASPYLIHDQWIGLVAAATMRLTVIDEPLVLYRQHAGQQVGAPDKWEKVAPDRSLRAWQVPIASGRALLGHYRDLFAAMNGTARPAFGRTIADGIAHYEARLALPAARARRVPAVLRELASGRYRRFSAGLRSAAKDLARPG